VDPTHVNLKNIRDDVRYRIFEYLWGRGVRSRELEYDSTVLNRVKNRRVRVSDHLLEKLLKHLTLEEFAKLVSGWEVKPPSSEPSDLSNAILQVKSSINVLRSVVTQFPQLSSLIYQEIADFTKSLKNYSVKVSEDHILKFEKLLRDRSRETSRKHIQYLRKALKDLGFELNAEKLQEYVLELMEESMHVARHTSKSLKLFIKLVLKDPNLYSSFRIPRVESPLKDLPSLDDVKAIAKAVTWPPAKAYYALLVETGLRPGEVFSLKVDDVDFEKRMVKPKRITNTKRAYISFFSEPLRKYLTEEYLPYRSRFIDEHEVRLRNLLRNSVESWKTLLFPFKDSAIRSSIYDAMDKTLGRRFKLYDFRAFYASYMSLRGVPGQVIDILQGRMPPSEFRILTQHYLAFQVEDLKKIYDQAGLSIL